MDGLMKPRHPVMIVASGIHCCLLSFEQIRYYCFPNGHIRICDIRYAHILLFLKVVGECISLVLMHNNDSLLL